MLAGVLDVLASTFWSRLQKLAVMLGNEGLLHFGVKLRPRGVGGGYLTPSHRCFIAAGYWTSKWCQFS